MQPETYNQPPGSQTFLLATLLSCLDSNYQTLLCCHKNVWQMMLWLRFFSSIPDAEVISPSLCPDSSLHNIQVRHCNILYVRLSLQVSQMLQLVQNSAAHLLMSKNSFHYMTLLNTFPGLFCPGSFQGQVFITNISEEPSLLLQAFIAVTLCGPKLNDAFPQSDTVGHNPLPCLFQSCCTIHF